MNGSLREIKTLRLGGWVRNWEYNEGSQKKLAKRSTCDKGSYIPKWRKYLNSYLVSTLLGCGTGKVNLGTRGLGAEEEGTWQGGVGQEGFSFPEASSEVFPI